VTEREEELLHELEALVTRYAALKGGGMPGDFALIYHKLNIDEDGDLNDAVLVVAGPGTDGIPRHHLRGLLMDAADGLR